MGIYSLACIFPIAYFFLDILTDGEADALGINTTLVGTW
jgi:hypothetical protein